MQSFAVTCVVCVATRGRRRVRRSTHERHATVDTFAATSHMPWMGSSVCILLPTSHLYYPMLPSLDNPLPLAHTPFAPWAAALRAIYLPWGPGTGRHWWALSVYSRVPVLVCLSAFEST